MMLSSAISIVLSKEIQIPRIIILSVGSIIAIIHTQPYVFITIFNQCRINCNRQFYCKYNDASISPATRSFEHPAYRDCASDS
jgi:hypothetical protein